MKFELKPSELEPIKQRLKEWGDRIYLIVYDSDELKQRIGVFQGLDYIAPEMPPLLKTYYSKRVAELIVNDLIRVLDEDEPKPKRESYGKAEG